MVRVEVAGAAEVQYGITRPMRAEFVGVYAILLVACSRQQDAEHREVSTLPSSSTQGASARTTASDPPTPCPGPLSQVTFMACNPSPRFMSHPDCYQFQFSPLERTDGRPCPSGQMDLYVAAPQVMDVILASVSNAGPGRLVAKVVTVKSSFLDKFEAREGAELGVIELESSVPVKFALGEALLSNEIAVKEATPFE